MRHVLSLKNYLTYNIALKPHTVSVHEIDKLVKLEYNNNAKGM